MKRVLFASTAAAAMAAGSMAAAQGITVTGDARLGLGYNVSNAGGAIVQNTVEIPNTPDDIAAGGPPTIVVANPANDELRAVSRVRFGVRMTGETPTGITFGATIRADNSAGGVAGTAGNAFVSGIYGTLTMGDTAAAHQQHVGDLPVVGLTELGTRNEFMYQGNRAPGGAGYRPTVRYDFDLAGFGVSASSGRELDDVAIGASFSPTIGGATVSIGGGYHFGGGEGTAQTEDQWAVGLRGGFMGFTGNVAYLDTDGPAGFREIGVGLGTTIADIGLNGFYRRALSGAVDGRDAYGVGFTYNLGGGASLRGGVARVYDGGLQAVPDAGRNYQGDRVTAGDFGIQMSF
jgi:outer membrane protein OmpU